jgi:hypothetical protein
MYLQKVVRKKIFAILQAPVKKQDPQQEQNPDP